MLNRFKAFLFVIVLLAVALWSSGQIPQASEVTPRTQVTFLDVGQGDAILITTPNRRHVLVDGGPDSSVLSQLGQAMRFHERTFDLVIATHNDADHITGLIDVLERYRVENLWINGAIHTTNTYLRFLEVTKQRGVATEVVSRGKSVLVDGVSIEVLYPLEPQEGVRPSSQNSLSIVTKVTYGESSFLLTGDIAEAEEQELIRAGVDLAADVLKVPHHGSKSGLAVNFLRLVQPQYAVIQVGAGNRFGHPASSILDKLEQERVIIFRTDKDGLIRMVADGQEIQVQPPR